MRTGAAATTPTAGAQPSPSRGGHQRNNSREIPKPERGGAARGGSAGAAGVGAAAGGAGGVLAEGGGLGPSLTGMLGGQFGATDFGR